MSCRFLFGQASHNWRKALGALQPSNLRRVFPGWWLLFTGGILAMWGYGYHAYGFSAMLKPISEELGLSRAAASIPASIGRLEGGFMALLAGWITDRFGPRALILTGVLLISLSLALMYVVQSYWAFLLVWGIMLAIGLDLALHVPLQASIANWFVRKRGLASGMYWTFSGLSGMLILPLVAWLITVVGWRATCLVGGVVMFLVGMPLVWFFVRQHRPEYYGMLPDGANTMGSEGQGMEERGRQYAAEAGEGDFTLRQAIRTPAFWLLCITGACHSLTAPAVNVHGIPFLTDLGIDPLTAASILALMVTISIPARFIGGFLADRVDKNRLRFLIGAAYLMQALGFALFLLHQTEAMIYAWFVVYGFGMGVGFAIIMPIRARYFGRKSVGRIIGMGYAITMPISMIGPIWTGWIYDSTGNYIFAFYVMAGLLTFAGMLALSILPPKPPARQMEFSGV